MLALSSASSSKGGRSLMLLRHSWFMGAILGLAFMGMAMFSRGFLQVRKMVEKKSQCSQAPAAEPLFPALKGTGCWAPHSRRKIILLVIDALRIDFVLPPRASGVSTNPGWLDHLTILTELAKEDPLNANLFHFIADPPTATAQRLTGLTAGSLPAFIEVTSNFAESSLSADNIVYQLLNNNRNKLDILGDDTWLHLFPEIKQQSTGIIAGYHSFHLFDLDSVDDGIIKHLYPRVAGGDYDVLVAHFLGVDHCGHKHGPAHWQCGRKLKQMDGVLRDIINSMDETTQLIVLSDHGMTDNGDHGGISDKEVGSMLFSYKKPAKASDAKRIPEEEVRFWQQFKKDFDAYRIKANGFSAEPFFKETCDVSAIGGTVPQIDFASTFSLIAGIPIPFGNIGSAIPELLIDFDLYQRHDPGEARRLNLHTILDSLRMNALQVNRLFLESLQLGQNGFDRQSLRSLTEMVQAIEARVSEVDLDGTDTTLPLIYAYYDFLVRSQRHCRRVWADFNMPLIVIGLALACVAVLTLLILYVTSQEMISWNDLFCLGVSLVHSISLSATSFIAFENSTVRFFLSSVLLAEAVASSVTGKTNAKRFAQIGLALLLIRLSSETGACREEQYPFCQVVTHRTIPLATTPTFFYYLSLGLLGMAWVVRQTHESLEDLKGTAKHVVGHLLYFSIFALLTVHWLWTWLADTSDAGEKGASGSAAVSDGAVLNHMFSIILPRVLFLLSILGVVIYRRNGFLLVTAVASLVGVVLRPFGGWITLATGVGLLRLGGRIFAHSASSIRPAIFYYLAGAHLFFVSGHQMTLTNLQWEAAFVGVRSTIQSVAALLMSLNTFSGPIVATVAICSEVSDFSLPAHVLHVYLWYAACQMVLTGLSTAILMRHLMVWKMFTPRFLLQVAQNVVVLLIVGTYKSLKRRQP